MELFPSSVSVGRGDLPRQDTRSIHQVEALSAINVALANGENSGYLNMATGLRKTYIAADVAAQFIDENHDARVLYLCHQNGILEQARNVFEEAVPGVHSHGNMYDGVLEDSSQIVYATFQTLNKEFEGGKLFEVFDPKEFDLVVVDESHHAPANTYSKIVEYFEPEFRLGLTPAPDRRDERSMDVLFGREIHRVTLEEAIADGSLATPDYRILTDRVKSLEVLQAESKNLTLKDIEDNLFVKKQSQEVVSAINEHVAEVEDPRMIVFASGIAAAEEFAALLPGAKSLHSDLSKEEQRARLKDFRNGTMPTIVAVDQLNEGIDVPEANVLVFLRATESKTIFLQQLGRGLRKIAGKDSVLVLDFVASWNRLKTVRDLQSDIVKAQKRTPPKGSRPILLPKVSFNYSKETMDAIDVIQEARRRTAVKKAKALARVALSMGKKEKAADATEAVKQLLGLESLPDQSMSATEREDYGMRIVCGEEGAIDEYYMRNLRPLYLNAKKYKQNDMPNSFTIDDYFQIASEAFLIGCREYGTANTELSFKDYIGFKVFSALDRAGEEAHTIHNSLRINTDGRQLKEMHETKNDVGESEDEIVDQIAAWGHTSSRDYLKYLRWELLEDIDGKELHDVEQSDPFERAATILDKDRLREALENLSYRERRILELRFGLGGEMPRTLEEVGRTFNVTRERIMGIEKQTLKKLSSLTEVQDWFAGDSEVEPPRIITEREKAVWRGIYENVEKDLDNVLLGNRQLIRFVHLLDVAEPEVYGMTAALDSAVHKTLPASRGVGEYDYRLFDNAARAAADAVIQKEFTRLIGVKIPRDHEPDTMAMLGVINYTKTKDEHFDVSLGKDPTEKLSRQLRSLYQYLYNGNRLSPRRRVK